MRQPELIAKKDKIDFDFGDDVVELNVKGRFFLALLVVPTLIVQLSLKIFVMGKIIDIFTFPVTSDILQMVFTLLFFDQVMDDNFQLTIILNDFGVVEDAKIFSIDLLRINDVLKDLEVTVEGDGFGGDSGEDFLQIELTFRFESVFEVKDVQNDSEGVTILYMVMITHELFTLVKGGMLDSLECVLCTLPTVLLIAPDDPHNGCFMGVP